MEAHFHRATCHFAKGRLVKAIADFTRVIELEPYHANAYAARANMYLQKGDNDKADVDFRKAKELKRDQ